MLQCLRIGFVSFSETNAGCTSGSWCREPPTSFPLHLGGVGQCAHHPPATRQTLNSVILNRSALQRVTAYLIDLVYQADADWNDVTWLHLRV